MTVGDVAALRLPMLRQEPSRVSVGFDASRAVPAIGDGGAGRARRRRDIVVLKAILRCGPRWLMRSELLPYLETSQVRREQ